jgi:hypothetical protein
MWTVTSSAAAPCSRGYSEGWIGGDWALGIHVSGHVWDTLLGGGRPIGRTVAVGAAGHVRPVAKVSNGGGTRSRQGRAGWLGNGGWMSLTGVPVAVNTVTDWNTP